MIANPVLRLVRRDLETGNETELYRADNAGLFFPAAISSDGNRLAFMAGSVLRTVPTDGRTSLTEIARGRDLPQRRYVTERPTSYGLSAMLNVPASSDAYATHRSSGENCGTTSIEVVDGPTCSHRVGRTLRAPAPSARRETGVISADTATSSAGSTWHAMHPLPSASVQSFANPFSKPNWIGLAALFTLPNLSTVVAITPSSDAKGRLQGGYEARREP